MASTTRASKSAPAPSGAAATPNPKATRGKSRSPTSARKSARKSTEADYLRDYRSRRRLDPRLRMQRKLRMMNEAQVAQTERYMDRLLGKTLLPDPLNPWATE